MLTLTDSERRALLTEQSNVVKQAMKETNASLAKSNRSWLAVVLGILAIFSCWRVLRAQTVTTIVAQAAEALHAPGTRPLGRANTTGSGVLQDARLRYK